MIDTVDKNGDGKISFSEFRCVKKFFNSKLQFRRLALKSPPLGPKWDRWAKNLGCASDPPVCSLLV